MALSEAGRFSYENARAEAAAAAAAAPEPEPVPEAEPEPVKPVARPVAPKAAGG